MTARHAPVRLGLLAGLAWALAACGAADPDPGELSRMTARCVEAMVRSTCRALGPDTAAGSGVVFVAGIGAVDGDAYRRLRASGEAMCSLAEGQCRAGWDSPGCRTARSLWLSESLAAR